MLRRGGTLVCNGLPTGDFPVSIFDTVLNGITIRGSIVGTRLDLQESLDMAAAGKVKATVAAEPLEILTTFSIVCAMEKSKDVLSLIIVCNYHS